MSIKEQEEEAKKHGFTIEWWDDEARNDADRDFFWAELEDEDIEEAAWDVTTDWELDQDDYFNENDTEE